MTHNRIPPKAIPDWFLQTVRNIETELRHAMGLDDTDPRLIREMQYVRDALGAVKSNLSAMDTTAGRVLSELAKPEPAELRHAAAG